MTELDGFERRLLHALTDIDASRPSARPTLAREGRRSLRRPTPARRRGRTRVALVIAAMTLASATTAVAAASGLFSAAPPEVKKVFTDLNRTGDHRVQPGKAVRIGAVDDHAAYAAPTADGGFCLYYASNPRSGPTGSTCIPRGAGPGEVVFDVLPGSDAMFVFGRVGGTTATTVTVTFPDGADALRTPVGDSGFFLGRIPDRAMRTLMIEFQPGPKDPPTKDGGPIESLDLSQVARLTATATDADGNPVAHGVPATMPVPGMPGDTPTPPSPTR
jgi:hypothetical protein